MFIDEDDFIEHYGKKGMKWGVRGTRRAQKAIDSTHRISKGKGNIKDKMRVGGLVSKKSAAKRLERGAKLQTKIANGEKKALAVLIKVNGIRIKDLNYRQT